MYWYLVFTYQLLLKKNDWVSYILCWIYRIQIHVEIFLKLSQMNLENLEICLTLSQMFTLHSMFKLVKLSITTSLKLIVKFQIYLFTCKQYWNYKTKLKSISSNIWSYDQISNNVLKMLHNCLVNSFKYVPNLCSKPEIFVDALKCHNYLLFQNWWRERC